MIVKGSVRENPKNLGKHLTRRDTNQVVLVVETWGLAADEIRLALRELDAVGRATSRCRKTLYHLTFNPAPEEEFFLLDAAMIARRYAEKELNLTGQPGIQIAHVKGRRVHFHTVWLMVRDGKLIPYGHNYRAHERIARHLEKIFDHAPVIGAHDRENLLPRPARTLSRDDLQQQERTNFHITRAAADITEAWTLSDSGRSFKAAIECRGYLLAHGNSRDVVVIDLAGGVHSPSRRIHFLKAADVTRRLSDLDPKTLPTVLEARAILLARREDQDEDEDEDAKRRRRKRPESETPTEKTLEPEIAAEPVQDVVIAGPAVPLPTIGAPVLKPERIDRTRMKPVATPEPEVFVRPNASLEDEARSARRLRVGDHARATAARPAGVVIDSWKGALVVKAADRVYLDDKVNRRGVTIAVRAAVQMHGDTLSLDGSQAFRDKVVSTMAQNRGLRLVKLTGADGVALEKARTAEAAEETRRRVERRASRVAEQAAAQRLARLASEDRDRRLQTLRRERARAEEAKKKEEDEKKKKAAALLAQATPMPFAPSMALSEGLSRGPQALPGYLRGLPSASEQDWKTSQLPRPFTPKGAGIRIRQLDRMLAAAPYIMGSERPSGVPPEPDFDDGFSPNPSAGPDTGFHTWKPSPQGMPSPDPRGNPWWRPSVSFDIAGPTIRVLDPKAPNVVKSAVRRALWRWDPSTIEAVGPSAFVQGVDRIVKAAQYAARARVAITASAVTTPAIEVAVPAPVTTTLPTIEATSVAAPLAPDTTKENIAKLTATLGSLANVVGACRRLGGGGATPEELDGAETAMRAALSDYLAIHTHLGKNPVTPSIRITPVQAIVGLQAVLGLSPLTSPPGAAPVPAPPASPIALNMFGSDPRRQAMALVAIASQAGYDPVHFIQDHCNAVAKSRTQDITDQGWRQASFDLADPQRGRADRLLAVSAGDKRLISAMNRLRTTSVDEVSRGLGAGPASSSAGLSSVSESALSAAQWEAFARSKGQDAMTLIATAATAAAGEFKFFLSRAAEAQDRQRVAAYLGRGQKEAAEAVTVAEATIGYAARLEENILRPPETERSVTKVEPAPAPLEQPAIKIEEKRPTKSLGR